MRKSCLILAVLLLVFLTIPAYAAGTVEPRAYTAHPTLTFTGTTAKCNVVCKGEMASDRISATLTLYHEGEYVDSWSASGNFRVSISGECEVDSGETYVLEVVWSVNGSGWMSDTTTNTCP